MKTIRQNINGIILCLFELVVGILLLINPVDFTTGIIIAAGIALVVLGVISVVKYFRADPVEAAASQTLMIGLIELLAGAFCVVNSYWFVATFPVLTMLYGLVILLAGIGKVQISVDMYRLHKPRWYFVLISALVSIICAMLILNNPFASTTFLWIFTGVSLIIEAAFDVFTLSFNRKSKEIPVEEPEVTDPEEYETVVDEESVQPENELAIIDANGDPAPDAEVPAENDQPLS